MIATFFLADSPEEAPSEEESEVAELPQPTRPRAIMAADMETKFLLVMALFMCFSLSLGG